MAQEWEGEERGFEFGEVDFNDDDNDVVIIDEPGNMSACGQMVREQMIVEMK